MGPTNGVRVGKPGTKPEGKRKCSPRRVKNCLRTFLAHLFSHIGLCILVVGYAIAGAAIFEQLESGYENEQMKIRHKYWNETFQMVRQQYVTELWNITGKKISTLLFSRKICIIVVLFFCIFGAIHKLRSFDL